MRVLHVSGCYAPATEWGGVVTAVRGMLHALSSAGVEVELLTTTQRSRAELPAIPSGRRDVDGVPVSYFRSVHRLGRAFWAPGLGRALRARAPSFDLVHLHMLWTAAGIVAARHCRARGIPYVVTLHGALNPWALRQRAFEKRVFLAAAERRNLRGAARLHFTTEAERDEAPPWVRTLPAVVVPDVVDAERFVGLGNADERAHSFEVLLLSRIHAVKGFDLLVPAMRRVRALEPRARLVVAGPDEGGHRAVVERQVAAAGLREAVTFTGLLDETGRARALARAALLVAPSHQENFGMSVAEAMSAGLPVIVSDRVNLAGDVQRAGAGEVVPLDEGALADAILRVLRDPARRSDMGAAGRRLVTERFSSRAVGGALRAAYASVLSDRSRRSGPRGEA
ncbi:glycosyl transferase group 1 [Anaeromyxobacter dehalogenans 2CP-1]|uniref:Glycosyl transferase group 1 n=1 Tax=Anaeromyxobacter dehalogenans (strain ATCC BAA-258 / DSM 21875 / 2CP-1) TaxID=455488 RepID=B8JGV1_ANAD2|nr:glycosyltransferase [Anaeromyxobacter dehalogenans]ACL66588.1 glycosyl transferase group 1 [Anaeromyxobacter dehalogenans 2CP-1]